METAVGDDKVGRFFLHQPCYHFRCQTSSVNGTPHMSVSVADLLCGQPIAEALEDYVRLYCPAFYRTYPRPSLSPPFDLRIFPVSCALEREGVDSRLNTQPAFNYDADRPFTRE